MKDRDSGLGLADLARKIPTEEDLRRIAKIQKICIRKKNRGEDIVLRTALGERDFFFALSFFSAQEKACEIEKFLIGKMNCKKVSATIDRGDCVSSSGKYIEIKTSTTNKANNLNIRQIRLWQKVDYYLCSFIDERNLENSCFFFLTKDEMAREIEVCGSYTHGTKDVASKNVHQEFSISFPVNKKEHPITSRWNRLYRRATIPQID